MKTALSALVSIFTGLFSGGAAKPAAPVTLTYTAWDHKTGSQTLKQSILVQSPDPAKFGPGPYPVMLFIPATYMVYTSGVPRAVIAEAAANGWLAASVQYDNMLLLTYETCPTYTSQAAGIFGTHATSAASTVCAYGKADCKRGLTAAATPWAPRSRS